MKLSKANLTRALDQPSRDIRFYLFHGPDEGQSRALAARLAEGQQASRILLSSGAIKSDPAALVDQAGALSLFGGTRVVWIEPATKDIEDGITALLEGPPPENFVVAIAGTLTKASSLLKIAESSPLAAAFASYAPEGQDAERMVADLGRRVGLKVSAPVAARLADACGNDQAIVLRELEKLALYLDASPHAPKELEHDALDDVGAESAESDFLRLADLALGGDIAELTEELVRLPTGGAEAIPVVRSLQRRLLMLAPARARIERGERVDAVMTSLGRAVFFKEKARIQRMLSRWKAADLAIVTERASRLERSLMFTDAPEREALGEELLAIARKARSL
ncbi:DNA polymerase III subunit delta [Sphingomonas flavescens]|uniref:DNA polymerase III subunit delta n=1 Tax=Sphingomonas flavescens TaxID=3132797 RepID=UPI0028056DDD|nr:DNA polymerase III subunit delta [Sphingomonas limnosediminicola]